MVHSYGGYTTNLPLEDLLEPVGGYFTWSGADRSPITLVAGG